MNQLCRGFISRLKYDFQIVTIYLIVAEWRIYAEVNSPTLFQIMTCRLDDPEPL